VIKSSVQIASHYKAFSVQNRGLTQISPSHEGLGVPVYTILLGTTNVSMPNGTSFSPTAFAGYRRTYHATVTGGIAFC